MDDAALLAEMCRVSRVSGATALAIDLMENPALSVDARRLVAEALDRFADSRRPFPTNPATLISKGDEHAESESHRDA